MHRLIERFPLQRGAHPSRGDGMCAMEMVAWLAGEPHSDEPRCTCPVLAAFVRACNDVMTDTQRNRYLRPLVPTLVNTRAVNTRANARLQRVRGFLVLDVLVRRLVPAWLRLRKRGDQAAALEQLAEVADEASLNSAVRALDDFAPDLHAACWVVQRAAEGMPATRFVAGAAQVARAVGQERIWLDVVRVIEAMAALSRPQPRNPVIPNGGAEPIAEALPELTAELTAEPTAEPTAALDAS